MKKVVEMMRDRRVKRAKSQLNEWKGLKNLTIR